MDVFGDDFALGEVRFRVAHALCWKICNSICNRNLVFKKMNFISNLFSGLCKFETLLLSSPSSLKLWVAGIEILFFPINIYFRIIGSCQHDSVIIFEIMSRSEFRGQTTNTVRIPTSLCFTTITHISKMKNRSQLRKRPLAIFILQIECAAR